MARQWRLPFMGIRRCSLGLSAALVLGSLILLLTRGVNLGIDFTGGALLQVEYSAPVTVADVRASLVPVGFEGAVIQAYSDRGVIIRISANDEKTQKVVLDAVKAKDPQINVLRLEKVGPVVGEQLRREAYIALSLALVGMLGYITFRFRFRFAVVSIVALAHDAIITLGAFSLLQREISVDFIAAILTIVGYSINDTIVVLDRVRENWGGLKAKGIADLLDDSINQTLSRTINTSLTTLLAVLALFVWGGPVIANFSIAMLIGILIGTYSSIYIAGALLCEWYLHKPAE